MYVSSVAKLLDLPGPSKHMKEFTLEQNLMHVKNVEKPTIGPVNFKYT
jgi:hypothetical protein